MATNQPANTATKQAEADIDKRGDRLPLRPCQSL